MSIHSRLKMAQVILFREIGWEFYDWTILLQNASALVTMGSGGYVMLSNFFKISKEGSRDTWLQGTTEGGRR